MIHLDLKETVGGSQIWASVMFREAGKAAEGDMGGGECLPGGWEQQSQSIEKAFSSLGQ